jgi:steroid delta-isomerase
VGTPEQTRAAVDGYVAAWNKNDRDAFLALWASDAVQIDPVPSPPNVGTDAIAGFWDNAHAMAESIEFEELESIVCGSEAALRFQATARAGGGGMTFGGVDIIAVNDDGKIASLKAYWDPARVTAL